MVELNKHLLAKTPHSMAHFCGMLLASAACLAHSAPSTTPGQRTCVHLCIQMNRMPGELASLPNNQHMKVELDHKEMSRLVRAAACTAVALCLPLAFICQSDVCQSVMWARVLRAECVKLTK